jgi:hypothetical protein
MNVSKKNKTKTKKKKQKPKIKKREELGQGNIEKKNTLK